MDTSVDILRRYSKLCFSTPEATRSILEMEENETVLDSTV